MYVDIYTKYFDNFFAWPFNLDFYVNSLPLCLMVQFSIINFVCDNYLLLVMNYGNRNPYQIISFMIFQCSSELDLFWKIIKNSTNFGWKQKNFFVESMFRK